MLEHADVLAIKEQLKTLVIRENKQTIRRGDDRKETKGTEQVIKGR